MNIESLQEIIRATLVDFEMYEEIDEELINVLSGRILGALGLQESDES